MGLLREHSPEAADDQDRGSGEQHRGRAPHGQGPARKAGEGLPVSVKDRLGGGLPRGRCSVGGNDGFHFVVRGLRALSWYGWVRGHRWSCEVR